MDIGIDAHLKLKKVYRYDAPGLDLTRDLLIHVSTTSDIFVNSPNFNVLKR